MHKPIRKPRIGDVAARAGVSTATVSRTLATPDRVTAKTRDAVMKAVRETGYVLNGAARNLRTSRSHAVLAVLPDASNIFFSQVLRGISDTLHQNGYSLVIADTANDPGRARRRRTAAQRPPALFARGQAQRTPGADRQPVRAHSRLKAAPCRDRQS
jgi:LacI family repressor for deo operon, udp, cdd, tsx, nupC, and nupG